MAIANRSPTLIRSQRHHHDLSPTVYEKGATRWQVSYFDGKGREIVQVIIDDATARVTEAWTGFQVAWTMARGYPGAFGSHSNALYVWLPLCVLFLAPFVTPRRPLRWLHFDLLAVLALSISFAFFNHADIGMSVPLSYPPLLYLLVRALMLARRGPSGAALRLSLPTSWVVIGLVFLIGFRITLNVLDGNVVDIGYASVIGASHLAHGQGIYGHFPASVANGDTYGPVTYYAYVPFERLMPWSGRWDDLPAAHGAALFFDLATTLVLWLLGRRLRGPTLGLALAYAWVACPFTLLVLNSNSNDSLVALLVACALLAAARPALGGAAAALAGLTKFAPLALAPLLAAQAAGSRAHVAGSRAQATAPSRWRAVGLFVAAFAAVGLLLILQPLLDKGLVNLYQRTIGYQAARGSPFSIWGLYGGLGGLQHAVQALAVALALALAALRWRRRQRDLVTLAAAAAAILIAVQLGITHWFYLYAVWFLPALFVALLAAPGAPERPVTPRLEPERAVARSRPRAMAATR